MKVEVKQAPKTLLGVNPLALIIIGIAIKDMVKNKFASENKFNPASQLNQNTRMPALHLERGNTREKKLLFLFLQIVLPCLFVFTLKYRCKGNHIIEPFPKNVKDIYVCDKKISAKSSHHNTSSIHGVLFFSSGCFEIEQFSRQEIHHG